MGNGPAGIRTISPPSPALTIGAADGDDAVIPRDIYAGIKAETQVTGYRVAESVKCLGNAFHAIKVAFANEAGAVLSALGVDGVRIALALATSLVWAEASADEAFVANQSSDDLTIVDLSTMKAVATLPIGGKPAGVAVARDGSRACVTKSTSVSRTNQIVPCSA